MNEVKQTKANIIPNGPAVIVGKITLTDADGNVTECNRISICRCSLSQKKPYCDGSHKGNPFE